MRPISPRIALAFTLIELLTVLSILSVLTAILFPVFAQARESARQVSCASNMKQLGLAMRLYLQDSDEFWFPAAGLPNKNDSPTTLKPWLGYDNRNIYWPDTRTYAGDMTQPATHPIQQGYLDPYLKNAQVKRCPSMPTNWQMAYVINIWNTGLSSFYYMYGNPGASGLEYSPVSKSTYVALNNWAYVPVSDAEVQQPASTVIGWEHGYKTPFCNLLQTENWFAPPPDNAALRAHFHLLHRSAATTVWCDGHVKLMRYASLRRPMFTCRKDIYL